MARLRRGEDGFLYGRGAVDMKGGIACQRRGGAGLSRRQCGKPTGSISFLITGDEEDISVNGTIKLLQWAAARARNSITACSANPASRGNRRCIKVGRRGSQSGTLYVDGVQGHVAYPPSRVEPGA